LTGRKILLIFLRVVWRKIQRIDHPQLNFSKCVAFVWPHTHTPLAFVYLPTYIQHPFLAKCDPDPNILVNLIKRKKKYEANQGEFGDDDEDDEDNEDDKSLFLDESEVRAFLFTLLYFSSPSPFLPSL
jgi:hypothetical protein